MAKREIEKYALRWLTTEGTITGVTMTPKDELRWTKTKAVAMARIVLGNLPDTDERKLALQSFTVERIQ